MYGVKTPSLRKCSIPQWQDGGEGGLWKDIKWRYSLRVWLCISEWWTPRKYQWEEELKNKKTGEEKGEYSGNFSCSYCLLGGLFGTRRVTYEDASNVLYVWKLHLNDSTGTDFSCSLLLPLCALFFFVTNISFFKPLVVESDLYNSPSLLLFDSFHSFCHLHCLLKSHQAVTPLCRLDITPPFRCSRSKIQIEKNA